MTGAPGGVEIRKDGIRVQAEGRARTLPIAPLYPDLLEWFIKGRKAGFESLREGKGPGPLFSRHLPVVSTTAPGQLFPSRLAHKGVGFLPKRHLLEQYISRYAEVLAETSGLPAAKSLARRLEAAAGFLDDVHSIDARLLGSLEIFAGGTYRNLAATPLASLLFADPGPDYRSFQLDCAVQILHPPDPRFRFLQLARGLFERDPFHVTQPGFHCAYLFWITGIHEKTPRPVDEKNVPHKL